MRRHPVLAAVLVAPLLLLAACGGTEGETGSADQPVATTVAPTTTAPPTTTTTVPVRTGPVKVLVVGDSVMLQIGEGLARWAAANPGRIEVLNEAHIGCGTTRGGLKRYEEGTGDHGTICATWADPVDPVRMLDPHVISWRTAVDVYQPDVVLSWISGWDAIDRLVPALGDQWVRPGVPAYDAFAAGEYGAALDVLSSTGATVAWLVEPFIDHAGEYSDPARLARLDEVIMPLVTALPRHEVIDLRGWLGGLGSERDRTYRPDGTHIALEHLPEVSAWIGAQVEAAGWENRTTPDPAPSTARGSSEPPVTVG